ncbi:MAG: serine hydrolase [Vulcanimicrobiota bacterium]
MEIGYLNNKVKETARNLEPGILAVGYHNLLSGEEVLYNQTHVFPAASIVKICILLEYERQITRGLIYRNKKIILQEKDIVGGAGILLEMHRGMELTLEDLMRLTIVISDNTASNVMLDQLGMDNINKFMESLGLKDTVIGRKFMIDPNAKFSKNFTSIRDMILLLKMLYKGEVLNEAGTKDALEIMSRQQYREKIPLLLPNKLKIAHKTGEITGVRHDCAIVFYEKAPYIMCFLTEKMPDVVACDRQISLMSKEFYIESSKQ